MYTDVTIHNFRGLTDLTVGGLRRLNLIVGRNNSGKTTVLEALFLLGGTDPKLAFNLGAFRGQSPPHWNPVPVWQSLFSNLDPSRTVDLSAHRQGEGGPRSVKIEAIDARTLGDVAPMSNGASTRDDIAMGAEMIEGVAVAESGFSVGGLTINYGSPQNGPIPPESRSTPTRVREPMSNSKKRLTSSARLSSPPGRSGRSRIASPSGTAGYLRRTASRSPWKSPASSIHVSCG